MASISFVIVDSDPEAEDDEVLTLQNRIAYGDALENDALGADADGGIVEIGHGDQTMTADDADSDGRVTLEGAYGVVVFDFDDGTYEYYSDSDALEDGVEEVIDEFYYKIADSDGDEDTAHLNFHIVTGDALPDEAEIGNLGIGDSEPRTDGITYTWSDLSDIDTDLDLKVDGVEVIKGFMPDIDRLDIDGLLTSLGFENIGAAGDVFRLVGSGGSIDLQVDYGGGWQTFANVSNSPPLTLDQVESAIIA
jgi:hypothetical protein